VRSGSVFREAEAMQRLLVGRSAEKVKLDKEVLAARATLEARVEHSAGLQAQITALRQRLGGSV